MKLVKALSLVVLVFAATNARADMYNYSCTSMTSPDSLQLTIDEMSASITDSMGINYMGVGNGSGDYQFNQPMVMDGADYNQPVLSTSVGQIGAQYLEATLGDAGDGTDVTQLDCTLH